MKNRIMNFMVLAAILLAFGAFNSVHASVIELDATDSGFYDYSSGFMYSDVYHDPNDREYTVSDRLVPGTVHDSLTRDHNFFVFDLSGINVGITDATICLARGTFGNIYTSSITYGLYEVSTPVATLVIGGSEDNTGVALHGIFDDLGSGVQFGTTIVNAGDGASTDILSIDLSTLAVASINASLGSLWAIGGSVDSHTPTGSWQPGSGHNAFMFGATGSTSSMKLCLNPVPEPSTILLLGSGLVGLAGFGRKKFKK